MSLERAGMVTCHLLWVLSAESQCCMHDCNMQSQSAIQLNCVITLESHTRGAQGLFWATQTEAVQALARAGLPTKHPSTLNLRKNNLSAVVQACSRRRRRRRFRRWRGPGCATRCASTSRWAPPRAPVGGGARRGAPPGAALH